MKNKREKENGRHNTHILSDSSSSENFLKSKNNSKLNSDSDDENEEGEYYDAPKDEMNLKDLFNMVIERNENNIEKSEEDKSDSEIEKEKINEIKLKSKKI